MRWTKKEDKAVISVLKRVTRKSDAVTLLKEEIPYRTTSAIQQRVMKMSSKSRKPLEQKTKQLKVEVKGRTVLIHL
jgi:predicted proteasome-type protease